MWSLQPMPVLLGIPCIADGLWAVETKGLRARHHQAVLQRFGGPRGAVPRSALRDRRRIVQNAGGTFQGFCGIGQFFRKADFQRLDLGGHFLAGPGQHQYFGFQRLDPALGFGQFIDDRNASHHHQPVVANFPNCSLELFDMGVEPLRQADQMALLALFAGHAVFAAIDLDIDFGHAATPPWPALSAPFPLPQPAGATHRARYRRAAWRGRRTCPVRWPAAPAHAPAAGCRLPCGYAGESLCPDFAPTGSVAPTRDQSAQWRWSNHLQVPCHSLLLRSSMRGHSGRPSLPQRRPQCNHLALSALALSLTDNPNLLCLEPASGRRLSVRLSPDFSPKESAP